MTYKYQGKKVIAEFEDVVTLGMVFPQFQKHFPPLMDTGVITKIETDNYQWNYSKSSLAEYFMLIANGERKNMEWGLIEQTFKIKYGTLRRLASTNGNLYKLDNPEKKSKDFEKILKIIR